MTARPDNETTTAAPVDQPGIIGLILESGIVRRSFVVAFIVGIILNLIAQGDFLVEGLPLNYWKIALTFCVPYCVATYGAVTARLAERRDAE